LNPRRASSIVSVIVVNKSLFTLLNIGCGSCIIWNIMSDVDTSSYSSPAFSYFLRISNNVGNYDYMPIINAFLYIERHPVSAVNNLINYFEVKYLFSIAQVASGCERLSFPVAIFAWNLIPLEVSWLNLLLLNSETSSWAEVAGLYIFLIFRACSSAMWAKLLFGLKEVNFISVIYAFQWGLDLNKEGRAFLLLSHVLKLPKIYNKTIGYTLQTCLRRDRSRQPC